MTNGGPPPGAWFLGSAVLTDHVQRQLEALGWQTTRVVGNSPAGTSRRRAGATVGRSAPGSTRASPDAGDSLRWADNRAGHVRKLSTRMSNAFRRGVVVAIIVALSAAGCAGRPGSTRADRPDGCITDFHPGTDYFPDKSILTDATNFAIDYHNSYQVLTVKEPYPDGEPETYVLVRCGAPDPPLNGELSRAARISVPVTSLYSGSSTHLGMLSQLGQADVVTGVADRGTVVDPQIRRRIDAGAVAGYAPGQQVNVEAVIAARPDVLVTAGFDDASYPKLRSAGTPVVADAEWLETTPLGRAEWIKVFAALTGTEKRAAEVFHTVREQYQRITRTAAGAATVDVLPGAMYQGTWWMPTGADHAGRLIADAGGAYPWAGNRGRQHLQLNFESVFSKAGRTPLWLTTSDWQTLDDALAQDSRYAQLAAVRDGQVWSSTKAVGPGGRNDFWERGVARPDLVLSDLVAILHPDLAPGHQFQFYRRLHRR